MLGPSGGAKVLIFLRKTNDFQLFGLLALRPFWGPSWRPFGGLLGGPFGQNLVLRSAKSLQDPSWSTFFLPLGPSRAPQRALRRPLETPSGPREVPEAIQRPKMTPKWTPLGTKSSYIGASLSSSRRRSRRPKEQHHEGTKHTYLKKKHRNH